MSLESKDASIGSKLTEVVVNWFENQMFCERHTVGRIKVANCLPDEERFPGFSVVTLAFPDLDRVEEPSKLIYRVPRNWFKEAKYAEIIVWRSRISMPVLPVAYPTSPQPKIWMVAIRPYPEDYMQAVDMEDERFREMFRANFMTQTSAPSFYEKFIK